MVSIFLVFFWIQLLQKMVYKCSTCGSTVVYHHCRPLVLGIPRQTVTATRVDTQSQHAPQTTTVPNDASILASPCSQPACDVAGCKHSMANVRRGLRWSTKYNCVVWADGDNLCKECYTKLRDRLKDYVPLPPGKPGAFRVAQARKRKRVPREDAVTLLWCRGRLIDAEKFAHSGVSSVSMRTLRL